MSKRRTSNVAAPESLDASVSGKKIVLVVTGGVAAYKAATLARLFVKAGASVRTALSDGALRFITPLTFEALTGEKAVSSLWDRGTPEIEHVSWAEWADLLVVAPATANFLAQAAAGEAGSFPLATLLAHPGPVLLAPAMNRHMLHNPLTQRNISTLRGIGHHVMGAVSGELACGDVGEGRMPEPHDIFLQAARLLTPGSLKGKHVLVTGGTTLEPWDSIRFLSNRSTGLMGIELARAAWLLGAKVELILGPTAKDPGVEDADLLVTRTGSTADLLDAVKLSLPGKDALFMAAAPADFRPEKIVSGKIKKSQGEQSIPLVRNPDILMTVTANRQEGTIYVGFNADQEEILLDCAKEKLIKKKLDFIVANPAGGPESSFASPDTKFYIIEKGGEILHSGKASKFSAAWTILNIVFGDA
jgi:phosphopantothenoylcysteine decarboxylase/phosphopantothenate--cysteine ligase